MFAEAETERRTEQTRLEKKRRQEEQQERERRVALAEQREEQQAKQRQETRLRGEEEDGPYFQLAPAKQEDSETGMLKETVRALEQRIDKLINRVRCAFWRKAAKRKGRHLGRTNMGEMGDGRVVVGSVRVNGRHRRKISRLARQLLEQEWRKHSDERWNAWLKEREMNGGVSAGDGYSPVNRGGVFSVSAGRGSLEPGISDQGRIGAGRELRGPGSSSRECNNVHVTGSVLAGSSQSLNVVAATGRVPAEMAGNSMSHRNVRDGAAMRTFNMSSVTAWAGRVPIGA